jgi:nitroreductase
MSIAELSERAADTSVRLLPALAERWSPRSFDPTASVDEDKLTAALEAARWSPSANNTQPWRFIVARRGGAAFEAIEENLMGFNKAWAGSASVLIVALAEVIDAEGAPRRFDIDDRFLPVSITALGTLGDPDALPAPLRERELSPRTRAALDDVVVVNA